MRWHAMMTTDLHAIVLPLSHDLNVFLQPLRFMITIPVFLVEIAMCCPGD